MGLTWVSWDAASDARLIRLVEAGASFAEMAAEIDRSAAACKNRVAVLRKRGTLPPLRNNRSMATRAVAAMRRAAR